MESSAGQVRVEANGSSGSPQGTAGAATRGALRGRLVDLYELIASRVHLCLPDVWIGERGWNATLLLELLAYVCRGSLLLLGPYGWGKTTSAQVVAAILGGMPLRGVRLATIQGTPGLTEERAIAPPNLGKLVRDGIVEPVWTAAARFHVMLIDELTRIPEILQSGLLTGADDGQFKAFGGIIEKRRGVLYSTANYERHRGSFEPIDALIDRHAWACEVGWPGPLLARRISEHDTEAAYVELGLRERGDEAEALLTGPYDPAGLEAFSDEFRSDLAARGVPTLSTAELDRVYAEIRGLPLSEAAEGYLMMLLSAMSSCVRTRFKRLSAFVEDFQIAQDCPADCRFHGMTCSKTLGGGSHRLDKAIRLGAAGIAWLTGASVVSEEHLRAVAPFALLHRATFSRALLDEVKAQPRRYSVRLEASRRLVEGFDKEYRKHRTEIDTARQWMTEHPAETREGLLMIDGAALAIEEAPHPFIVDLAMSLYPELEDLYPRIAAGSTGRAT